MFHCMCPQLHRVTWWTKYDDAFPDLTDDEASDVGEDSDDEDDNNKKLEVSEKGSILFYCIAPNKITLEFSHYWKLIIISSYN